MHTTYLLIIFAATVLITFSISMNMLTIPDTQAIYRALISYTRAKTTIIACSDNTEGITGTCNGCPTPYMPSFPSSLIKTPSFGRDKGNRYSKYLRFRIELDSIFDTPTYTSYSQGLNCLNSALDGPRDAKVILFLASLNVMQWN